MTADKLIELIDASIEDNPFYSREAILALIQSGEAQLWNTDNSILVTELIKNNQSGALSIQVVVGGGELSEIIPGLTTQAEQWAKSLGAKKARFDGRPGWVRAMRSYGYHEVSRTAEKDL